MVKKRKPTTGHGELLKALTALPGITDQQFRIACCYLSHTRPPILTAYPSAKTVARLAQCSERSVHRAKKWLKKAGAIWLHIGGGHGKTTTVDFTPLATKIISAAHVSVLPRQQPKTEVTNSDSRLTVSQEDTVTESKHTMTSGNPKGDTMVSHKGPNNDISKKRRTGPPEPKHVMTFIPDQFLKGHRNHD